MKNVTRLLLAGVAFSFASLATAGDALDAIDDVRVGPLVKSKWDQKYAGGNPSGGDPCYNRYTPNQCYCGCGPTCFAQIMRYHEWPKTVVDTTSSVYYFEDGLTKKVTTVESYPCKYQGSVTNLTMIGGVYDWSKMPYETQKSGTSPAEREMIGRLCYDLGVSVCADYNSTAGTGASSPAFIHSLPGNFHYADAAAVEWNLTSNLRTCDPAERRQALLRALLPNLDAGLPCALMIDGSGARHIIVCDGYGYHGGILHLHLNVGYSGNWDGWYPLDGSWSWKINNLDYTSVAGIVYNISPLFTGPIMSGRIVNRTDAPVAGASVSVVRDGTVVTNVVSNVRGEYVFKVPPGDYAVTATKGTLSRTMHLTLQPCVSTAYLQNGDYYQTPVAVRIANKLGADILLDATAETVAAPTSIPFSGTAFKGRQAVELYTQTDGAEIHYTLDGTIPDRDSPIYVEPIEIDRSTTVRAIAYRDGLCASEIGVFRFVESTYGELLGTPDTTWTSGGFAPWCRETAYDLNGLLRSGQPDVNPKKGESSWLEAEIEGPASVSFDYRYNPSYYFRFVVTLDGAATDITKYAYYVSSPSWESALIDVPAGLHRVRLAYVASDYGIQSNVQGVHLRNMKIVYPNVLTASLNLCDDTWTWLLLKNGNGGSGMWSTMKPSEGRAKVTVENTLSYQRMLTVNDDPDIDTLTLRGLVKVVSSDNHKLTAETVKVDGDVRIESDALKVTGALILTTKDSTVFVAKGVDLVPVSGVSGGRVVAEEQADGTLYSLGLSYVSPFSASPSGTSAWSALTFTDINGNSAAWDALSAGTRSRVTLNVASAATVNVNADVVLRALQVAGSGSLTLGGSASLSAEVTTVNADLAVASGRTCLGAVTLGEGRTLSVPTPDAYSSLVGAGTLRLTGSLSGTLDADAISQAGPRVVFAGTLTPGGTIRVGGELTVAKGANVQGTVLLTNLAARVFAEAGATVAPTSGVEYYEVTSETVSGGTLYTLVLSKIAYVGPFTAELDVETVNWADIAWRDAMNKPGQWADLTEVASPEMKIVTDRDVVITMSGTEGVAKLTTEGTGRVTLLYPNGKAVPASVEGALRDTSWTGTVKLAGSSRTLELTKLADYGNAGSTIELANMFDASLAADGRCESSLVLDSGCQVTLKSGSANTTYTFVGKLSGTGEFYFGGSECAQTLCFAGDVSEFCGPVNATYGRMVVIGEIPAGMAFAKNSVVVNSALTLSSGTWCYITDALVVNGLLTIESGVKFTRINSSGSVPVRMTALSAQFLTAVSMTVLSGIAGESLKTEKVEGGTLYTFVNAPAPSREPTIEGGTDVGTIAKDGDGNYVVSLVAEETAVSLTDVTTQTIVVPPQTSFVIGVPREQLMIKYGEQSLTSAFQIEGDATGLVLALGETNAVLVGTEWIPVRPEPTAVNPTSASVGVKSIPGLYYSLLRSDTPAGARTGTPVATERAEGPRISLTDDARPSDRAFYVIRVSNCHLAE